MTVYDDLSGEPDEQFLYLLGVTLVLPHPVISVLMNLDDENHLLDEVWQVWCREEYGIAHARGTFKNVCETLTGYEIAECENCRDWAWKDDTSESVTGGAVCDGCHHQYERCYGCSNYASSHDITYVAGYVYCDTQCLNEYCSYCDECEVYYRDNDGHECPRVGCDCEAPHQTFEFPANGHGTVLNDEHLDVTLPAGVIDSEGINRIVNLLYREDINWQVVDKAMAQVGDIWQTKKGNFTRRLSRELYNVSKKMVADGILADTVKVGDHVLSEIGNLARQHSSTVSEWRVAFTRDLNLSASEFCHEESCWFQSYYESRCALKKWGGIGLRAFDLDDNPVGRAWVQPVDAELQPTHNSVDPHGYVVYNSYGTLDEYKAARIVAHLASLTYKKVTLSSTPQYINGDFGILVAPEATTQVTDSVRWGGSAHHTYDADTFQTIPTMFQTNPTSEENAA